MGAHAMPVRDRFPVEYFQGNPLAGEDAHSAYKRLQWGNSPRNTWNIEAPEPMAVLGQLAKLVMQGGVKKFQEGEYFLSVGVHSNRVYFVPIGARTGAPIGFPLGFSRKIEPLGLLKRVDYYSDKGGEQGYYYHDHEKPYPALYGYREHFVVIPARHRGGRSYAVNDEGIIG
jgi:hypothetical protein